MTKPGLLNHRRSLVSETLDGHIEPAAVAVIFGQAACPAILESSCFALFKVI